MSDFFDTVFDTIAGVGDIGKDVADAAADFFGGTADKAADVGAVPEVAADATSAPQAVPSGEMPPTQGTEPISAQTGESSDPLASVRDPLKGLSPEAVKIISGGLAMGATAAMKGLADKNKLEAERDKEERARQDVIRRGQVQAFQPNAFTPKNGSLGIINGAMVPNTGTPVRQPHRRGLE